MNAPSPASVPASPSTTTGDPVEAPSLDLDRRRALSALGLVGLAGLGALASQASAQQGAPAPVPASTSRLPEALRAVMGWDAAKFEYVLPKLPYAYAALEPHLDAQTMEIHHSKHHQAYVTGLNKALAELAKARAASDFALVKHWSREVGFHGGGHVNHCLFWHTMAAPRDAGGTGGGEPTGPLASALTRDFGSVEAFRKHFEAAAIAVEASGWAWLVLDPVSGRLLVQQMEKQQNLLVTGAVPLLGVDVWEHAYYLRYQNKRADYVKAWWNVVNWPAVAALFEMHPAS